ncbi:hypothetical protein UFOVP138_33 [uncultured Caudovirales phage]|uniref:Uncharacterized protein n=1 Tax=uncultured Caudovirales phage TaxID=2100421 RepID=A0A6J5LBU2_9CAUD|nr:hypothetical protein UFOVP138_33 [uncultured Caudovirales phage]
MVAIILLVPVRLVEIVRATSLVKPQDERSGMMNTELQEARVTKLDVLGRGHALRDAPTDCGFTCEAKK